MEKIVKFDEYCPKCKHLDIIEDHEPCDECLCNATNDDSHKPVFYEEDKHAAGANRKKKNDKTSH